MDEISASASARAKKNVEGKLKHTHKDYFMMTRVIIVVVRGDAFVCVCVYVCGFISAQKYDNASLIQYYLKKNRKKKPISQKIQILTSSTQRFFCVTTIKNLKNLDDDE